MVTVQYEGLLSLWQVKGLIPSVATSSKLRVVLRWTTKWSTLILNADADLKNLLQTFFHVVPEW